MKNKTQMEMKNKTIKMNVYNDYYENLVKECSINKVFRQLKNIINVRRKSMNLIIYRS